MAKIFFHLDQQLFSPFLLFIIRLYQKAFSPLIHGLFGPAGCRFNPTCSQYTINSIKQHGSLKGLSLGISQIIKCHPFHR